VEPSERGEICVDLNEMKLKYGAQAVNELLDYVLIGGNVDWRLYGIKHGIIKQSTKVLNQRAYKQGYFGKTTIYLTNGRNQYVFTLHYDDAQLREFRNN
jgi:hypothetical protein